MYLFIYRTTNLYIAIKFYINHLEYLKYTYTKNEIFVIIFKLKYCIIVIKIITSTLNKIY